MACPGTRCQRIIVKVSYCQFQRTQYNFCKPNPSHDIINHYFVCSDYDSTINDILDEKIVETACKRSSYPKQIRNQVVRSLRAERKLLVRHDYFHIYIYIKSNHFYCHITTARVLWWVKFLRACSRQCKKTEQFTYRQYIFTDCTEDNVQNTHNTYSIHTVYL